MDPENKVIDEKGTAFTSDFGAFYPLHHIIAAFSKLEDAEQVRQNLITGGYKEEECVLCTAEEMTHHAEHNLEHEGWLSGTIGRSFDAVQVYLDIARQGATFLLIYAPNDVDVERVMNVIRRVPFILAERYRRLVIEDLH